MCPYTWKNIRSDKPIWFNSTISELAVHRDRLFQNYRRGARKMWNCIRGLFPNNASLIRLAKSQKRISIESSSHRCRHDQDKFRKTINDLLGLRSDMVIDKVYKAGTDILLSNNESIEEIGFLPA